MKKNVVLMLLLILSTSMIGQNTKKVYGYVKNVYGQPIEDVSVVSADGKASSITDKKGLYVIFVQKHDSSLVFKHKKYKTRSEIIQAGFRLDVVLAFRSSERLNTQDQYNQEARERAEIDGLMVKSKKDIVYRIGPGIRMPDNFNTENYATIHENGFRNVETSPLSTFSIDVDNASYSNVRRFINQGSLPPIDAVRIEEMINYFNYAYDEPNGKHPFSVYTELGNCPWNSSNYLLHIGLKGKEIDKSELPPSNLVFLIDVSGSMQSQNKLPLLKRAFHMLVDELRPNDRVALVVYAGAAGVVLQSTSGNKKDIILKSLNGLSAGGSTAGGEGIKLAYKIAKENFIIDGNNRIILATDGDFNVGVSSTSEMERLVEKERKSGVAITVLGFGMGNIKDNKMETIANKGDGNYAYIDNIKEARKVFITEFGGTLFTIAKDVKFQLEFNPAKVAAYRLIGYENRALNSEDFNDDQKDAGEVGSGHTVTALYEIIPAGASGNIPSVDKLKYQKIVPDKRIVHNEILTIKVRYKTPESERSVLTEVPVFENLTNSESTDFRFSAAVAAFGMYLRGSEHMGNTSLESILNQLKGTKGEDEEGYRAEFIQIVKLVRDMHVVNGE